MTIATIIVLHGGVERVMKNGRFGLEFRSKVFYSAFFCPYTIYVVSDVGIVRGGALGENKPLIDPHFSLSSSSCDGAPGWCVIKFCWRQDYSLDMLDGTRSFF